MEEEIEFDLQSKIRTTKVLSLTELIQYTPCISNEPTVVWLVIGTYACVHGLYIPTSVGQGVSLQSKFDETKEL